MSKCRIYNDHIDEIKKYCEKNRLDFNKLEKMSKCWGKDDLIFQYHDPEKGKRGLLDETPMPVVLMVFSTVNGLVFEQTECTRTYLS